LDRAFLVLLELFGALVAGLAVHVLARRFGLFDGLLHDLLDRRRPALLASLRNGWDLEFFGFAGARGFFIAGMGGAHGQAPNENGGKHEGSDDAVGHVLVLGVSRD